MKYKKLTILFKNDPSSDEGLDGGTHKLDFTDAVLMISGNSLIVTEHAEDGSYITGTVYPLHTVHSYRADKE